MELDAELASIDGLSSKALRERWLSLKGHPIPKVRPGILRLALAFELQATTLDERARRTNLRFGEIATRRPGAAPLAAGTQLTRMWKGELHTVTIRADLAVHWNGKAWGSLSEVARAITGTRWSGPAFFGLKKGRAA